MEQDFGFIRNTAAALSKADGLRQVYHRTIEGAAMPSIDVIRDIVEDLRAVIFPGFFGRQRLTQSMSLEYYIGSLLDAIYQSLTEQVKYGFCFACETGHEHDCSICEHKRLRPCVSLLRACRRYGACWRLMPVRPTRAIRPRAVWARPFSATRACGH
jgi:serine O-acetyltransferase